MYSVEEEEHARSSIMSVEEQSIAAAQGVREINANTNDPPESILYT